MKHQIGGQQNNVTVELSKEDAMLFMDYRKHQDVFKILADSGVFDTHSGSVVLHFDKEGVLRKIDKSEVLFLFVEKH